MQNANCPKGMPSAKNAKWKGKEKKLQFAPQEFLWNNIHVSMEQSDKPRNCLILLLN